MRAASVDGLRGLAILGMVASHALIVVGAAPEWQLFTRWVMPLFAAVAGACAAQAFARGSAYSWERWGQLSMAAGVTLPVVWYFDAATIPILVVFMLAHPLMILAVSPGWVATMGLAGVMQATQIPLNWGGFEPGAVLACIALGWLMGDSVFSVERAWLRCRVLVLAGQWPLSLYVGHWFALFFVAYWLGG